MNRRTFLKNMSVAAATPLLINAGCATAKGAKPGSGTMRILTCNIRVDVPSDTTSGNGWAQRRDLCADVIQSRRADLIGFQEVQVAHLAYLKDRLGAYATFTMYNTATPPQPLNAIFYLRDRFDLKSAGGFWISETPHVPGSNSWDSDQARFVVWVNLLDRKSGKELRFWNTHLDHKGQKAREHGADLIVQAGKPLTAKMPQLLTGDMNAGFDNRAIQILKDAGWTDTYAAIHGPVDPGFTAHGFRGKAAPATRSDGGAKRRIDWIFCRGPVKPIAASVIRDSRDGRYPSDHFFVSADVELT